MSAAGSRYMGLMARLGCVICKRFEATGSRINVHHVAEGSGKRNDFATVPLCEEHHLGGAGLHGMGTKAFCALYRPPFDNEYGLLVWAAQDLEALLWQAGMRLAA